MTRFLRKVPLKPLMWKAEEVQTCLLGVRLRGLWHASLIRSPGWHCASSFIMNEGSCEMLFNIEKQSGAG